MSHTPERIAVRDDEQPLSLFRRDAPTPEAFGDARHERVEYSAFGDRVPGRLLLPARGEGPFPVVLLQHGAGGSKSAPYMSSSARWVREGAAILSIDFPLHGERYSPKLSERLLECFSAELAGQSIDADSGGRALVVEFVRQSMIDLRRAIRAAEEHPALDASRLVYGGFSMGAMLGTIFCALDERPRAAALALAGGGFGPPFLDPANYIATISERPVLLLGARRDDTVPAAATERLYAAAREPRELLWFDSGHSDLPGQAMKAMWAFMRRSLGL